MTKDEEGTAGKPPSEFVRRVEKLVVLDWGTAAGSVRIYRRPEAGGAR